MKKKHMYEGSHRSEHSSKSTNTKGMLSPESEISGAKKPSYKDSRYSGLLAPEEKIKGAKKPTYSDSRY